MRRNRLVLMPLCLNITRVSSDHLSMISTAEPIDIPVLHLGLRRPLGRYIERGVQRSLGVILFGAQAGSAVHAVLFNVKTDNQPLK